MKKIIKLISIIMVICTLFCLIGCEKSDFSFGYENKESKYKAAMSDHMQNEHKSTITSYTNIGVQGVQTR